MATLKMKTVTLEVATINAVKRRAQACSRSLKKGDRDNLSKAECNALRKELQGIAEAYRTSVKVRTAKR